MSLSVTILNGIFYLKKKKSITKPLTRWHREFFKKYNLSKKQNILLKLVTEKLMTVLYQIWKVRL